jgi:16S rRNA (guanine527-N7)-methyltransferase
MHQLGLDLPTDPFLQYLNLLQKWNQAYNLTAVIDIEAMVTLHILDSLAILPWVHGERLLDVGSGPGLPGVPLALARSDLQVVLLDSNGKKIRFLQEVKRVLALDNVEIVQMRVENYHPSSGFDTVTSRALSELETMIDWTRHLVAPKGIWLAMKGRRPDAELMPIHYSHRIETYTVPGLHGERCCVIINS